MRILAAALSVMIFAAPVSEKKREKHSMDAVPQSAGDYLNLTMMALGAQNWEVAKRLAHEGQERYPEATGFHLLLGEAARGNRDFADAWYEYQWEMLRVGVERESGAKAREQSELILRERGTDLDEILRVAAAQKIQATDPKKALESLQRIESERGDRFVLTLYVAEAMANSGDPEAAAKLFRGLIKKDACFIPAYVELGLVLQKQGKKDEGGRMIAKAKELDPEHWRLKSLE